MSKPHADLVRELLRRNLELALTNGPRLSFAYAIFVVGRDRGRERALLGGLGGLGVGRMWVSATMAATHPGFADAPDMVETEETYMILMNVAAEARVLDSWRAGLTPEQRAAFLREVVE